MDAALETGIAHGAQLRRALLADIGSRQQGAVHQCFQAVVLDYRRARYLAEKAGPQGAPQGPARMVGAQREQKGGLGLVRGQHAHQIAHAFTGAAIGIDVDFQGQERLAQH
ncbi:hypothetical protein D3C72_2176740 [compost metagenome]